MIEAHGLTKHYGATVAVDDLSFTVQPGSVTGFLGPNGSGKSTTMRMIMGLDRPNAGEVAIHRRPYRDLPWPLREVGALLEARAIHPGRSAFNHLFMLAKSNGIPKSRVGDVLDLVGLSSVARQRAGKFSLGMGQRLGIAAALLGDPGVLLFDEPINGLDPQGILWVRNLLRSLADEGRTVFVSSHLMSEMALTADHLVVIGRGHLIAETSVKEFVGRHSRQFVRLRSPKAHDVEALLQRQGATVVRQDDGALHVSGLTAAEIGDLVGAHSLVLHELSPQSGSLEDAFMELTQESVEFHGDGPGPRPATVAVSAAQGAEGLERWREP